MLRLHAYYVAQVEEQSRKKEKKCFVKKQNNDT